MKTNRSSNMSQPPQAIGISDFDLLGALGSGSYSTVFRAKRKKVYTIIQIIIHKSLFTLKIYWVISVKRIGGH